MPRAAGTTPSSRPFQAFLPELEVPRENIVVSPASAARRRLPYYVDTYGMHSIHGRAPAIATGLAASRPDLSVWVITGDGDALSIGGNHLIHALRRNVNIKILLFNNRIYGLTKGQYSPTSEQGKVTKSTPVRVAGPPVQPGVAGARRGGELRRRGPSTPTASTCTSVLRAAADHQGAAFIEIYQNCPIFNDDAFAPAQGAGSRRRAADPPRARRAGPLRPRRRQAGLRFGSHGSARAVDAPRHRRRADRA